MKVLNSLKKDGEYCGGKYFIICGIISTIIISLIVSLLVNFAFGGEKRIKSVIEKDPEFIVNSIDKMYREKQKKEQENRVKKAPEVATKMSAGNNPYIGNKNGSKVIVEFFDYACGHCKKESEEIHKVIAKNKNVKVVLADLAIMSQHSLTAAQVGIYVGLYDHSKLEKYYTEMSKKQVSVQSIKEVLKTIGLPENYIEKSSKDIKVREILEKNFNYAKEIGLQGTPALIIDGKFIPGYATADDILSILK